MADNTKQLIGHLAGLISESRNPASQDIDLLDSMGIVQLINDADKQVSLAIESVLPTIAESVDVIVATIKQGGRLVYIGAGTSGRMGVLDAVECVPTFGVADDQVTAVMAGGEAAMFRAQEGVEDDGQAGINDLKSINFTEQDILVGIAASGRTPYVLSALEYAQSVGARTIALSCNPDAEIAQHAEIAILPVVGPEVLTGSTRMKAGTAQKLVLNMLSTASMIRLGKSFHNLMVDVQATNDKLKARGQRILMEVTGVEQHVAAQTLQAANGQVKTALFMLLADCDWRTAEAELKAADGFLRQALIDRGIEQ